jgi:hypothetical protein
MVPSYAYPDNPPSPNKLFWMSPEPQPPISSPGTPSGPECPIVRRPVGLAQGPWPRRREILPVLSLAHAPGLLPCSDWMVVPRHDVTHTNNLSTRVTRHHPQAFQQPQVPRLPFICIRLYRSARYDIYYVLIPIQVPHLRIVWPRLSDR